MKDSELTAMSRVGLATTLCAVLSGVEPVELQAAWEQSDVVVIADDGPMRIVSQMRRLSTNSTDDGLNTGTWAAIISGSVAGGVLVLGLLWYCACRSKAQGMSSQGGYSNGKGTTPLSPYGEVDVPDARNLPPNFFHSEGASADHQEIPLLRMSVNAYGAREDV